MPDLVGLFIPLLFAACFSLLSLALLRAFREGEEGYTEAYAEETARAFEDLFLFIPPARIAQASRALAALAFVSLFLMIGDLSQPRGALIGFIFGSLGAALAMQIPRLLLNHMKRRRLEKFNQQLPDALMTMSNALRAGFSIQQSFDSVAVEGINPLAQEFSMMLQESRVGVRFEDAMKHLEERVGSEDLTLMIRAIETARLTGGNLTEVFEQIASTIRERIRIEGRVKSLTAMGRLQALVVGAFPAGLLAVILLIDPDLMTNFLSSSTGLALIALAAVLEVTGFLLIRKLVAIDV